MAVSNKIILKLYVVPNSSRSSICGEYNGRLKIKISAPAVENKANKEIIKFISKYLKIKKSNIEIKHGKTSKRKDLIIYNLENIDDVIKDFI